MKDVGGLVAGVLFAMRALGRGGDLVAGVVITFQNFTLGIFDVFTMSSERNWDMSSVDEKDCKRKKPGVPSGKFQVSARGLRENSRRPLRRPRDLHGPA